MRTYERLFIDGDWVLPEEPSRLDVVSPHSTEIVGTAPNAGKADVARAVGAARRAFDDGEWPQLAPAERAAHLKALAAAYEARVAEMGTLITEEMGSPLSFSHAVQAYAPVLLINSFVDIANEFPWEQGRSGMLGETVVRREPVGVVAAIVPWNTPQLTALTKLVPALLSGCTVVLKPAPQTPLDGLLLGEIIDGIGLPKGVVNIVTGGREAGEELVTHPGVDKVAFTGSTDAGRRIAALCGANLKRVTLELGGKSAAIILDDADLSATVEGLRMASFMNSGQTCIAQTRILASRNNYAAVVEAIADLAASLRVGDPMDAQTEVGPLVSQQQQRRVQEYIDLGQDEGARIAAGGSAMPCGLERGWYVRPTVFANADNGMRIAQEEIFGPVLTVIPFSDSEDAVRIANASRYGLAGSVWTGDVEQGMDIARRIRVGSFGINQYALDFVAPGGGFKDSGIGREGGREGFEAFVEPKSILAKEQAQ
ncbi:Geranial dehydrogenase [Mycolicibacterium vanbaalenii]|uniref:aldehyde dehydrogenase (NAD(+)) n=2 Tax=Mycolicibacterium vanbaalenii TaxID=110539 RepID=A0A5S9QZI0_MYCVN|nr:Geranial dehydrogenase [Mycolicibacterium vanbaalenii]